MQAMEILINSLKNTIGDYISLDEIENLKDVMWNKEAVTKHAKTLYNAYYTTLLCQYGINLELNRVSKQDVKTLALKSVRSYGTSDSVKEIIRKTLTEQCNNDLSISLTGTITRNIQEGFKLLLLPSTKLLLEDVTGLFSITPEFNKNLPAVYRNGKVTYSPYGDRFKAGNVIMGDFNKESIKQFWLEKNFQINNLDYYLIRSLKDATEADITSKDLGKTRLIQFICTPSLEFALLLNKLEPEILIKFMGILALNLEASFNKAMNYGRI